MNEHPILFGAPMVRAILEGRKTQTRRPVKAKYQSLPNIEKLVIEGTEIFRGDASVVHGPLVEKVFSCPHCQPGTVLWVRETAEYRRYGGLWNGVSKHAEAEITYCADAGREWRVLCRELQDKFVSGKRPSIHMPYWAARIFLRVKSVRVQRLCDITEEDAKAEGFKPCPIGNMGYPVPNPAKPSCRAAFLLSWEEIYGRETVNPWVWVIEFERVEGEVQS